MMAVITSRWTGHVSGGRHASWASAMRQMAAQPVVYMDQGCSAPVGGRWVARWINVTLIGFALSVRKGHAKGQTHLFGRARDPGQGGKTEYLGVPRGCRCSGLHRTAIHAQDMAGQVPLDPPAQACKMQLHICQLPMSGGDGPPPSSPGIAGAGRPLRRLGGLGDEGEPPPAPALHASHYARCPPSVHVLTHDRVLAGR